MGLLERGTLGYDVVHHPEPLEAMRVHFIAGHEHLLGDVKGQGTGRSEQPTARRDQSALHLGKPKACAFRGDDEITGQGGFESAPESYTLHRCDQRLAPTSTNDSVLPTPRAGFSRPALDVGTRTKDPGSSGQDPDPDLRVVVELIEG